MVVPDLPYLKESTNTETSLGNPALATEIEASAGTKRKELEKVMEWSLGSNDMIEQVVHNLLSFPRSRESLQKLQGQAVCWSFRRRPRSPKTGVGWASDYAWRGSNCWAGAALQNQVSDHHD